MNCTTFFKNIWAVFILGIVLYSCENNIEIPGGDLQAYDGLYMSEAVRNPNAITLRYTDSVQDVVYGASFGGYGYPKSDIHVKFEVNTKVIDSFNQKNGTDYSLLPSEVYELSQPEAVIAHGKLSTAPLLIHVNPGNGMELFKKYILPVAVIDADNNYPVNEALGTSFYIVQASLEFSDFPDYDRSSWSVYGVSSEEPAEGPTNGGVGGSAIDGRLESFWHTK